MTYLELNPDEQRILQEVLDRCLSDLQLEILHTDHAEFKSMLKQRKALLEKVVARFNEPIPV